MCQQKKVKNLHRSKLNNIMWKKDGKIEFNWPLIPEHDTHLTFFELSSEWVFVLSEELFHGNFYRKSGRHKIFFSLKNDFKAKLWGEWKMFSACANLVISHILRVERSSTIRRELLNTSCFLINSFSFSDILGFSYFNSIFHLACNKTFQLTSTPSYAALSLL